jgi:outer membrane scaffolding protein for murein synthesis (MipA/OmpV family)
MPGLDYPFGLGPQLVWTGLRDSPGAHSLHLKLRAMFSTDLHRIDRHGTTFVPEVRWRFPAPLLPGARLGLSLQPTWGSRDLLGYFYAVAPSEATPSRPAYAARAGYLGTETSLTLTRREGRSLSWFVAASALSLHGAANAASPLLRSRSNFNIGAGFVWTPWQSEVQASD